LHDLRLAKFRFIVGIDHKYHVNGNTWPAD
jgi:hypothetical protein